MDVNKRNLDEYEDQVLGIARAHPVWKYAVINPTGVTVVKATPGLYGGYRVLGNAGAFTMDVYDHPSAASGQRIDTVSVAAAANQQENWEMTQGIVVNMSGDPTDNLILIRWR